MSTLYHWRKGGVLFTAGFLAFTSCSCSNAGDSMPSDETSTQIEEEVQTEGIQIDEELSAYVADGVVLPEDFRLLWLDLIPRVFLIIMYIMYRVRQNLSGFPWPYYLLYWKSTELWVNH